MTYNPALAVIMATAMIARLADRKNHPAPAESEEITTTNTISPAQQAEMDRAPRAYRRRQMKELRKMKI